MFKIFSVDDHIIEPADLWTSRVPSRYRDRAPHVITEDGDEYWIYEDQRGITMGLSAVAGLPPDRWSKEPARFTDMIPGCYSPQDRVRDLLSQGTLASLGFPSLPRFGGMLFTHFKDKELADHCVRAWNDFILDEWCPSGPEGLFVPMVICQAWDPALAARELERCIAKGARALSFVDRPVSEGLPSFHTEAWDPIWSVLQDAGVPMCLHIGSGGLLSPLNDPLAPEMGRLIMMPFSAMAAMTDLLLSPVCHRFPNIKIVFSEAGVGWVPSLLERADRSFSRQTWTEVYSTELLPSEIFRRNMYVCMVEEPVGLSMYEHVGADRIMSELDYPHSDTTWPSVQPAFQELLAGIPADVADLVTHGNAERVFNWKMADPALLEAPDVVAWRAELAANPYAAMGLRPMAV